MLESSLRDESHEFWPADLSIAQQAATYQTVRGHNQVTDAYLVALADRHGGKLATFDAKLAASNHLVQLIAETT